MTTGDTGSAGGGSGPNNPSRRFDMPDQGSWGPTPSQPSFQVRFAASLSTRVFDPFDAIAMPLTALTCTRTRDNRATRCSSSTPGRLPRRRRALRRGWSSCGSGGWSRIRVIRSLIRSRTGGTPGMETSSRYRPRGTRRTHIRGHTSSSVLLCRLLPFACFLPLDTLQGL